MAVVVNTHNKGQENALVEFLESAGYDYKSNPEARVTEHQAEELLKLITPNIADGEPRSWEEIRKELKSSVVVLMQEAGIDIETPCYWYENPHIGLAGILLKEIDNYFDLISQNPLP